MIVCDRVSLLSDQFVPMDQTLTLHRHQSLVVVADSNVLVAADVGGVPVNGARTRGDGDGDSGCDTDSNMHASDTMSSVVSNDGMATNLNDSHIHAIVDRVDSGDCVSVSVSVQSDGVSNAGKCVDSESAEECTDSDSRLLIRNQSYVIVTMNDDDDATDSKDNNTTTNNNTDSCEECEIDCFRVRNLSHTNVSHVHLDSKGQEGLLDGPLHPHIDRELVTEDDQQQQQQRQQQLPAIHHRLLAEYMQQCAESPNLIALRARCPENWLNTMDLTDNLQFPRRCSLSSSVDETDSNSDSDDDKEIDGEDDVSVKTDKVSDSPQSSTLVRPLHTLWSKFSLRTTGSLFLRKRSLLFAAVALIGAFAIRKLWLLRHE